MTALEIITYMESLRNEEQRKVLMRFFKTGPGEYGEGDEFLGLKVPQTREVVKLALAKEHGPWSISEVPTLLMSRWHEVRLCGLLMLVAKFEKLATKRLENDAEAIRKRDEIVAMYLQYAEQANNWDLVDLSVHKILGHWLLLPTAPLLSPQLGGVTPLLSPEGENMGPHPDLPPIGEGDWLHREYKIKVLDELAQSPCLWKQRMSIVCTWKTSQMGDPSWCLRYAEIHLHHPHDLMHKAVGWMLREMGKRVSMELLREFLRQHAHEMPRTMLRYAIEKMPERERKEWMSVDGRDGTAVYGSLKPKMSPFAGIPVADFVDIILQESEKSDEALYYLLHRRLQHLLRQRYEVYQHQLYDGFEDIVEDFFLYLREDSMGQNRQPYQPLRRIKKKEAFESWLLNTFRNYLGNRARAEENLYRLSDNAVAETTPSAVTDEQKIMVASQLIAYAHQVFYPRGRFIFLRTLLTMLNKQKALPNKEIAQALGMTDISYRVTVHRMKRNLMEFRTRLLQGERLRLDDEHQQMANHIYDDFSQLYPILLAYYNQAIDTLKCAHDIRQLRQKHFEATGTMAHEPEATYTVVITASGFWEKLSRLLIV